MEIRQLVIFTILNYTFENIHTILKTELYDHDKKPFYDMWILILTANTNNSKTIITTIILILNNNNTNNKCS